MSGKIEQGDRNTSPETLILDALKSIKYGKVEVVVHDSKIVQLETTEKIRFSDHR